MMNPPLTSGFDPDQPLQGMAIAETIRYANQHWGRLRWNCFGNSEMEDAIGFALKAMVENNRVYIELTPGQRKTNTSNSLEDAGLVTFRDQAGKHYATLTVKALAVIASQAMTVTDKLPAPPDSLKQWLIFAPHHSK